MCFDVATEASDLLQIRPALQHPCAVCVNDDLLLVLHNLHLVTTLTLKN